MVSSDFMLTAGISICRGRCGPWNCSQES